MSNSVDPDETARYVPSHLDLRYLQKPITIAFGSERETTGTHDYKPGPSCSKLTTLLVNDSLKFTSSDTQIC